MLVKHTLKPNESTSLTITYKTLNLPGPFRKTIDISTDIPGQEEVEITIEGSVKEAPGAKIQVTPRKLELGVLPVGVQKKQSVTIANIGALPLHIRKISGKDSKKIYFDASSQGEMVIDSGRSTSVELAISRDQAGTFTELLNIESDARNATKGIFVIIVSGTAKE